MFGHLGVISPPGIIAGPSNLPAGARGEIWVLPEPLAFRKPFPVASQQWSSFQAQGVIRSIFPDGWRQQEWVYRFAVPFPAASQHYGGGGGRGLGF